MPIVLKFTTNNFNLVLNEREEMSAYYCKFYNEMSILVELFLIKLTISNIFLAISHKISIAQ